MNNTDNKPKYIKFADGRHGAELEVLADELAPLMPKETRGKLAPSVLWMARHYKAMHDDNRVNLEKARELEQRNDQLERLLKSSTVNLDGLRQEVDRLKDENARLKDSPATQPKRTIEQSRQIFAERRCPLCEGDVQEKSGAYGKFLQCESCKAAFSGRVLAALRPPEDGESKKS